MGKEENAPERAVGASETIFVSVQHEWLTFPLFSHAAL
jgi:hypothetical protein